MMTEKQKKEWLGSMVIGALLDNKVGGPLFKVCAYLIENSSDKGEITIGYEDLEDKVGHSKMMVSNAIKFLKNIRALEVIKEGKPSNPTTYKLNSISNKTSDVWNDLETH